MLRAVAKKVLVNSSRVHLDRFIAEVAGELSAGAMVLDAGAGDSRYRDHFHHVNYESADFAKLDKPYASDLTYVCDLRTIPVEDGRFDLVLLTQVLEHLPAPQAVLGELRRVLKPGGKLCLTAPLYFPEHEQPYDFFRYTQFAYRRWLPEAGFDPASLNIEWLEGYLGTLSFQLEYAARWLPVTPSSYGGGTRGVAAAAALTLARPLLLVVAMVLARSDIRFKVTSAGHCKNYRIVAIAH